MEERFAKEPKQKFVAEFHQGVNEQLLEEKYNQGRRNEALSRENEMLYNRIAEAEARADHDALTGLLDRGGFERVLEEIRKLGTSGALLLLDIDEFKSINDTYGHNTGDMVLKAVAGRLKEICRESDIVARWGGEELVIFSPNTRAGQALRKFNSEELKKAVVNVTFKFPDAESEKPDILVTFSGGVTDLGIDEELSEAIERADQTLYHIKNNGRNRLELAQGGDMTALETAA